MTHLEVKWEEPSLAAMLRRLAEFSRLIFFDRRGCGLSDRGDRHLAPTLEERVADIAAVLDAVGSRRASFFGVSEGCAVAALFASMHPQRTERIILYGGVSRFVKDPAHPWGLMELPELLAAYEPVFSNWGPLKGLLRMSVSSRRPWSMTGTTSPGSRGSSVIP
jgi:pimeloyl-ACP methyl ester carboxylesterase